MSFFEQEIIPYVGFGGIKLLQDRRDVEEILKNNNLNFQIEHISNMECSVKVPWIILNIGESIKLYFAKNKLWKMVFCKGYLGALPNGIKTGMKMNDALQIDTKLEFEDFEEIYISQNGYWLEDNLLDGCVDCISIFIKEAVDDSVFYQYRWC